MGGYKRIYIGAGFTLLTLFAILLTVPGVTIEDLTGDITCSGTIEDPCVSYFNVVNRGPKSVYIYNYDEITLDFSPEIDHYELYVKYYGKWKYTNFTMDTRFGNIPKDRKYVFVFPRYATKEFKLVGYKNTETDKVKWGFGGAGEYLDPIWESNNSKLEFLKVREDLSRGRCPQGNCYVVWEIGNLSKLDQEDKSFIYSFKDVETKTIDKSHLVSNSNLHLLKDIEIIETNHSYDCYNYNVLNGTGLNGKTLQKCKVIYGNETKYIWETKTTDEETILKLAQNDYILIKQEVTLPKNSNVLGEDSVDVYPCLYGVCYKEYFDLSNAAIKYEWEFNENDASQNTYDEKQNAPLIGTSMVWGTNELTNSPPTSWDQDAATDGFTNNTALSLYNEDTWAWVWWIKDDEAYGTGTRFMWYDNKINDDKNRMLGYFSDPPYFRIQGNAGGGNLYPTAATFNNGNWNMYIAQRLANNTIGLYENGIEVDALNTMTQMASTVGFCLGIGHICLHGGDDNVPLDGVDQMMYIEGYTLTAADMVDMYNAGDGLGPAATNTAPDYLNHFINTSRENVQNYTDLALIAYSQFVDNESTSLIVNSSYILADSVSAYTNILTNSMNVSNDTLTKLSTDLAKSYTEKNDNITLEVFANDGAENSIRANVTFRVLDAPINITTINEYPLTNVTNESATIKLNMSTKDIDFLDNNSKYNITCAVYINGTLNTTTWNQENNTDDDGKKCNFYAENLTYGNYNISIWANESSGESEDIITTMDWFVFSADTTAPVCYLVSVTPYDIEANSTGTFELIVNCTDASGLNTTKEGDEWISAYYTTTVDSNGSSPNEAYIFYPDNNISYSSSKISQQVLRGTGRSEGHWFDALDDAELNTDNYTYSVYDGEYGHFKIQESGANWALFNISGALEHLVFKQSTPLNKETMHAEEKSEYLVNRLDGLMVLFYDLERLKKNDDYILTAFGNFNYTLSPNKDLDIYYCNQSYLDTTCSGSFTNGCTLVPQDDTKNCAYLNSLPLAAVEANRDIIEENSSYLGDTHGINSGQISGITTTNISYIYYRSQTIASAGSYTIRYANGSSGTDINFNESNLSYYSTDDGLTYTVLAGTPDIFITEITTTDTFYLGGCVWDNASNSYCNYSFLNDSIGDVNFPISSPSIQSYYSTIGGYDSDLNGTHGNSMIIRVNMPADPDAAGTVGCNLTLMNPDDSFNVSINNSGFHSPTDSPINITYDTVDLVDSLYKVNVTCVADDDGNDEQEHITYENFTTKQLAVTVDYPLNDTWYGGILPKPTTINWTTTNSSVLQNCSYDLEFNGVSAGRTFFICGTEYVSVVHSEGNYTVNVTVNKSTGLNASSGPTSYFIDSVFPEANLTYPVNNTKYLNISTINWTHPDTNFDTCYFEFDMNGTNKTLPCDQLSQAISLNEGEHNVSYWVNDSSGNENKTFIKFSLDNTPPIITEVVNISITKSAAIINWTTNEDANYSILYNGGDSSSATISTSPFSIPLAGLTANTNYTYNITACDGVGNCNKSLDYNFTTLTQTIFSYVDGRWNSSAVVLNQSLGLKFNSSNLNRTNATIEFWMKFTWDLDEKVNGTNYFFESCTNDSNKFRIYKNSSQYLVADMSNHTGNTTVSYNISSWLNDTWYHVGVQYDEAYIYLYTDAVLRDSATNTLWKVLPNEVYIGSNASKKHLANVTMDEFRISSGKADPIANQLEWNMTYYWYVVATDDTSNSSNSELWQFYMNNFAFTFNFTLNTTTEFEVIPSNATAYNETPTSQTNDTGIFNYSTKGLSNNLSLELSINESFPDKIELWVGKDNDTKEFNISNNWTMINNGLWNSSEILWFFVDFTSPTEGSKADLIWRVREV